DEAPSPGTPTRVSEHPGAPAPVVVADSSPFAFTESAAAPTVVATTADEPSPFAITDVPGDSRSLMTARARKASGFESLVRLVLHMVPLCLLFIGIGALLVHDFFFAMGTMAGGTDDDIDTRHFIKIVFDEGKDGADFTDSMAFAVHKIDPNIKAAPSIK